MPSGTEAPPSRKHPGRPATHNHRALRKAVSTLTTRRLDGRSQVAVAVRAFKAAVASDLGGDLSRLQETVLEAAAQKWVIASALADYIARQSTLVTRKRAVLPIVREYVAILDGLERTCERLGLSRVPRPVEDLHQYLRRRATEPEREDAFSDQSSDAE